MSSSLSVRCVVIALLLCVMIMAVIIIPMIITTALFIMARTSPFELIFTTDDQTASSGSISLQCRDVTTAEPLDVDQTKFWLNRTSACDPNLTAITDVQVLRGVRDNKIKFNLTRNLDGVYTCGRLDIEENEAIVRESTPLTLTSLQTIVSVPGSVQTAFTARVGETAILPCPIQPGALSQYYSVIWMKDGVEIIGAYNPQTIMPQNGNSRLDLDSAYSLIIHSVNLNDSSSDYQCMLFVTNPDTHTKQEVQPAHPDREITITLNITDEEITFSTVKPTSVAMRSPTEHDTVQPSSTECQQQDLALFIGLIVASMCVSLTIFIAVGIELVIIVVCCYSQRKCQSRNV